MVGDSLSPVTAGGGFIVRSRLQPKTFSLRFSPLCMVILGSRRYSTGSVEIKGVFVFSGTPARRDEREDLRVLWFFPVVAICARIWVRSEIRDSAEPLMRRCRHAPALSSHSSWSILSACSKVVVELLRSVSECKVVGRRTTEDLFPVVLEIASRLSSGV